jgi:hypothetical protein
MVFRAKVLQAPARGRLIKGRASPGLQGILPPFAPGLRSARLDSSVPGFTGTRREDSNAAGLRRGAGLVARALFRLGRYDRRLPRGAWAGGLAEPAQEIPAKFPQRELDRAPVSAIMRQQGRAYPVREDLRSGPRRKPRHRVFRSEGGPKIGFGARTTGPGNAPIRGTGFPMPEASGCVERGHSLRQSAPCSHCIAARFLGGKAAGASLPPD